jgi:precorrin-6A/cobalt-precorrin-6A reductase
MILLLAGTNGAREIAQGLADEKIPAIASLAGATRDPAKLAIKTRSGGFGGAESFAAYLQEAGITAIIDATHAFARRISARTVTVASDLKIPYLQLLRPAWQPQAGDTWVFIDTEKQAADHIPVGATAFLATGRQTLDQFSNLPGRRLICRQIDPPNGPFPFENGEFLVGRPPFSITEEVALFTPLGIEWLVVKNAGGQASRSKLDAARQLKIPVALINRPPLLDVDRVETVAAAIDWARQYR